MVPQDVVTTRGPSQLENVDPQIRRTKTEYDVLGLKPVMVYGRTEVVTVEADPGVCPIGPYETW